MDINYDHQLDNQLKAAHPSCHVHAKLLSKQPIPAFSRFKLSVSGQMAKPIAGGPP